MSAPAAAGARLADYATENLTLATTRYLLNAMKQRLAALVNAAPHRDAACEFYNLRFHPPVAGPPVPVRQGQWLAYFQAGMAATQQQYKRLWVALEGMKHKPTVILPLHSVSVLRCTATWGRSRISGPIRCRPCSGEALSAFAHTHGWQFLDLTEPLREAVQGGAVWLYGRYDTSHWSPQGTAVVADVLAAELLKACVSVKGSVLFCCLLHVNMIMWEEDTCPPLLTPLTLRRHPHRLLGGLAWPRCAVRRLAASRCGGLPQGA